MDDVEKGQNERRASRSGCKIMESTKSSSQASEVVAFHKVRRKFLNLMDMENEDPDEILICEFKGQDFELVAD